MTSGSWNVVLIACACVHLVTPIYMVAMRIELNRHFHYNTWVRCHLKRYTWLFMKQHFIVKRNRHGTRVVRHEYDVSKQIFFHWNNNECNCIFSYKTLSHAKQHDKGQKMFLNTLENFYNIQRKRVNFDIFMHLTELSLKSHT